MYRLSLHHTYNNQECKKTINNAHFIGDILKNENTNAGL